MSAKSTFAKELLSQRFQMALNGFMVDHSVDVAQLAGLISIPASSLYGWLDGSRLPKRARMQKICRQLGVDYAPMRDSSVLLDSVLQRAFLSFEALGRQYERARNLAPEAALATVALGATMLHSHIMASGLLADLRITRTYDCRLTLLHPPLDGLRLQVEGSDKGIVVHVVGDDGEKMDGCAWPLTDERVPKLIERLQTYEPSKAAAPILDEVTPAPGEVGRKGRRGRRKTWMTAGADRGVGGRERVGGDGMRVRDWANTSPI